MNQMLKGQIGSVTESANGCINFKCCALLFVDNKALRFIVMYLVFRFKKALGQMWIIHSTLYSVLRQIDLEYSVQLSNFIAYARCSFKTRRMSHFSKNIIYSFTKFVAPAHCYAVSEWGMSFSNCCCHWFISCVFVLLMRMLWYSLDQIILFGRPKWSTSSFSHSVSN